MKISAYAAAVAAVLCLAVAGCSPDEEPGGSSPTVTPTPTATTTDAAPAPPELPAAATKKTAAGAEAFVKYYWAVVDYSQANGTTELLASLDTPECNLCRTGLEHLEKVFAAGGLFKVGATRVVAVADGVATRNETQYATLQVTTRSPKGRTFYGPDDSRNEVQPARTDKFAVLTLWDASAGAWRIHTIAGYR